jgi:hypothetical protein
VSAGRLHPANEQEADRHRRGVPGQPEAEALHQPKPGGTSEASKLKLSIMKNYVKTFYVGILVCFYICIFII